MACPGSSSILLMYHVAAGILLRDRTVQLQAERMAACTIRASKSAGSCFPRLTPPPALAVLQAKHSSALVNSSIFFMAAPVFSILSAPSVIMRKRTLLPLRMAHPRCSSTNYRSPVYRLDDVIQHLLVGKIRFPGRRGSIQMESHRALRAGIAQLMNLFFRRVVVASFFNFDLPG